jgi:hypothetical protein
VHTEKLLTLLSQYIGESNSKNIVKVDRTLLIQCYGKIRALDMENKTLKEVN